MFRKNAFFGKISTIKMRPRDALQRRKRKVSQNGIRWILTCDSHSQRRCVWVDVVLKRIFVFFPLLMERVSIFHLQKEIFPVNGVRGVGDFLQSPPRRLISQLVPFFLLANRKDVTEILIPRKIIRSCCQISQTFPRGFCTHQAPPYPPHMNNHS